jgi:TPR repeat protein
MIDDTPTAVTSPDVMRAVAALECTAAAGNAEAQFRLGVMYANGDEVPLDYARAAELVRELAGDD